MNKRLAGQDLVSVAMAERVRLIPCSDRQLAPRILAALTATADPTEFPYMAEVRPRATQTGSSPAGRDAPLPLLGGTSIDVVLRRATKSHLVVCLPDSEELSLLASNYARIRGASFLVSSTPEDLIETLRDCNAHFLSIVAVASRFDDDFLLALQHQMASFPGWARYGPHAGLMVGRDHASVSRLMARTFRVEASPSDNHIQLMPFFEDWPGQGPGNMRILQGPSASAASLAEATREPAGIFSIYGHGTDDATFLGPDVICGASSVRPRDAVSGETGLPVCHYSNECFKTGTVVNARSIRCQIVFANICMGLKLKDALFDPGYSLALNFVDGWPAAYISAPANRMAWIFENLLFHVLCTEAGLSVGEALTLLNRFVASATSWSDPLLLIGDPSVRLLSSEPSTPPLATVQRPTDGSWIITGFSTLGHFSWAVVSDNSLLRAAMNRGVYLAKESTGSDDRVGRPSYWGILPDPVSGQSLVIQFSTELLRTSTGQLTLTTEAPLSARTSARLRSALTNLSDDFPVQLGRPPGTSEAVARVRRLRQSLARDLTFAQLSRGSHERVVQIAARLETEMQELENRIITDLAKRIEASAFASWDCYDFGETFERAAAIGQEIVSANACSHCGGPTVQHIIKYRLDETIQRTLTFCYHCGIQRDAPRSSGLLGLLSGPSHFESGGSIHQTLRLTNRSEADTGGIATVRIGKSGPNLAVVTPASWRFDVAPGQTSACDFVITTRDALLSHCHFAKAVILEDFGLVYGARPIWIQPRADNPNSRERHGRYVKNPGPDKD